MIRSISGRSLCLYLWTVFFFSLFQALPLLYQREAALFFHGWGICLLFWMAAAAIGAILYRCLSKTALFRPAKKRTSFHVCLLVLFVIGLLCSLPYFLALFPGTIGADASPQLQQYAGLRPLTTHHPIIHTLILGSLVDWGTTLFGFANGGAALYTAFQIVLCNYAFARVLAWMYIRRIPLWIVIGSAAFLFLNPNIQILLCYSTKDIPCGAAFLLFLVSGCQFLFDRQPLPDTDSASSALSQDIEVSKAFRSIRQIPAAQWFAFGGMIFWGVMNCLFRHQGLYILVIVLILAVLVYRREWKKTLFRLWCAGQVISIVIAWLCGTLLPQLNGIPGGDMREMLPVPSQQIAQAINQSIDTNSPLLSKDQLDQAESYFSGYDPEKYDRLSADPSKDHLLSSTIRKDPLAFVQTWLTCVLSDFPGAVFAWTDLIVPYFGNQVSTYFTGLNTLYSYQDYLDARGIHSQSLLPDVRDTLVALTDSARQKSEPMLQVLNFSWSLYLMIYLLGYGLIYKNSRTLYGSVFSFLYFLTLLLGPVALSRYLFVLVIQQPLWIGLLYTAGQKRQQTQEAQAMPDAAN